MALIGTGSCVISSGLPNQIHLWVLFGTVYCNPSPCQGGCIRIHWGFLGVCQTNPARDGPGRCGTSSSMPRLN